MQILFKVLGAIYDQIIDQVKPYGSFIYKIKLLLGELLLWITVYTNKHLDLVLEHHHSTFHDQAKESESRGYSDIAPIVSIVWS